jgi:hypothetical protein
VIICPIRSGRFSVIQSERVNVGVNAVNPVKAGDYYSIYQDVADLGLGLRHSGSPAAGHFRGYQLLPRTGQTFKLLLWILPPPPSSSSFVVVLLSVLFQAHGSYGGHSDFGQITRRPSRLAIDTLSYDLIRWRPCIECFPNPFTCVRPRSDLYPFLQHLPCLPVHPMSPPHSILLASSV